MEIQDTRRKRLSDWVTANGGYAAVVRAKNLTTSQASFLSQVVNGYSFGERAARAMEKRLGLSPSYLDNKDADNADRLARLSPRAVEVAALFDALPPKRQRLIYAQIQDMHNPDDDAAEDFSATLRQHPPRPAKCGLFFTLNSSVRLTQHQAFAKLQRRICIASPGHRRAAGGSREAQRPRSVHVRGSGGRGSRPPHCRTARLPAAAPADRPGPSPACRAETAAAQGAGMRQVLSFLFACALGVAFAAVIVFGPNGIAS